MDNNNFEKRSFVASIGQLRQMLMAWHFHQSFGTQSARALEKLMYPELAKLADFDNCRPKKIDRYLKKGGVPNANSLRNLELFCPGISNVVKHPIFLLLGDIRQLSDKTFAEVTHRLRSEPYEYRADPEFASSEYLRARCSLRKLTQALLVLRRCHLSMNKSLCEAAEEQVAECKLRVSKYLPAPIMTEILTLMKNGPLKQEFRKADLFEEENRFKRQFGDSFDFNRSERRAVYDFLHEAGATTNDIKLYKSTGNLKIVGGRVKIDESSINFSYQVGLFFGGYFALLLILILVFATPIPDGNVAEWTSRVASILALSLLARLSHLAFIKPKKRLKRLNL